MVACWKSIQHKEPSPEVPSSRESSMKSIVVEQSARTSACHLKYDSSRHNTDHPPEANIEDATAEAGGATDSHIVPQIAKYTQYLNVSCICRKTQCSLEHERKGSHHRAPIPQNSSATEEVLGNAREYPTAVYTERLKINTKLWK